MSEVRDVYMNRVQQRIFYAAAKDKRVLAARRFGKTDGVIGPQCVAVSESMPRGAGAWLGSSRKQLMVRTVPATIAAITRFFGLVEGIHFGYGQPPKDVPDCLIKPKTYDNVLWMANGWLWHLVSLSVFGSANSLTLNSLIADECKFLPERKILEEVMPALSGITSPTGDKRFSEHNQYYKSTCFVSDAALSTKGNWLERQEVRLDEKIEEGEFAGRTYREIQEELNRYADDIILWNELLRDAKKSGHQVRVVDEVKKAKYQALARSVLARENQFRVIPPTWKEITENTIKTLLSYHLIEDDDADFLFDYKFLVTWDEYGRLLQIRNSSSYQEHIRKLRCNSFYYVRANSLDNVDLLGEGYIAEMKRSLPPLVFMTSILNLPLQKNMSDGFYCNLDIEHVHGYIDEDCPAIDSAYTVKKVTGVLHKRMVTHEYETPDFEKLSNLKDCTLDGDCHEDVPLEIALDYNVKINWIITGQTYRRDGVMALNVISSFFVKDNEMIEELLDNWNRYYAPHRRKNRKVLFYYDHTARYSFYISNKRLEFWQMVKDRLVKHGWDVIPIYIGRTVSHMERYRLINSSLSGLSSPAIRMNRENNEALIIAMENCGLIRMGDNWKKDKTGEKLITNAQTAEGQENVTPAELRTDGTDAFDTLFIGSTAHRNVFGAVLMPNGRRTV